ncbi:MAG: DUF3617 domain-containing protein [Pseudomonadota bacterium]|nr:DUF3617 domain-containing protein [Pseudomonadota bacterium]MDP8994462.1 DUF3617 domain-containing protein [Pseudomonadota bacterium]
MRGLILLPLIALAACGGEGEQKAKAPERAEAIRPGQWESTIEITNLRKLDQGEPRLNLARGTRLSGSACVGPAEVAEPPPELFAGDDFDCEYTRTYMRRGRINIQMTCRHPSVRGEVYAMIDGRFTAETMEGALRYSTMLPTDGDVEIAANVTSRRTGDCTPAAGAEGNRSDAQ